jgi:site-specific DNA-methyltransferase (adenine-specific)
MARKPLIGTVAANVQAHGTGGLNIDACRIGAAGGTAKCSFPNGPSVTAYGNGLNGACDIVDIGKGRWPANVVLDEVAAELLDEQSGQLRPSGAALSGKPARASNTLKGVTGIMRGTEGNGTLHADSGGASRFFYTAKAGREDRQLEDGTRSTHPTVKPVDLMRWLVRLVTPPGGVVLDPFMGSGSTGVACVEEGFRFIGIEREPEYHAIAVKRLEAATRQGRLDL